MDNLVFLLIGVINGLGSSLLLFRFDAGWLKALSLSGGAGVLIGEFVLLSDFFEITKENRSEVISYFLISWIFTFLLALPILLRILKRQESKYKIHTWEILFGDKKALDGYYTSKEREIEKRLEGELNIDKLQLEREQVDLDKKLIAEERKVLEREKESLDDIISKNHHLLIPQEYKFPVTSRYFELLPRQLDALASFYHHVTSFTDDFVSSIEEQKKITQNGEIFKAYLLSLSYYIGQFLFDWRDIRIHYRLLDASSTHYQSFLAFHKSGQEYEKNITPMPVGEGLIHEATRCKRSLVKSANLKLCTEASNDHIWKDYITMIFENISSNGIPLLSLGISVKYDADHRDMLYFLSYIQIEQFLQENLLKLDDSLSLSNTLIQEVA